MQAVRGRQIKLGLPYVQWQGEPSRYLGIRMCLQCGGECVIWQESIDEQPWEKVRSSSPLKVKEDDEVDKLEIKINTPKRSKRTYPSPSPEVAMKISRSLRDYLLST